MPYKLRKAPGQALYWVVGEDGKHFSKEPMPKEKAKAQLRALYANAPPEGESRGAGANDIGRAVKDAYNDPMDGGEEASPLAGLSGGAVPLGQNLIWEVANSAYKKTRDLSKATIGDLTLKEKTDGMVLYVDAEGDTAFVGVRGTRPTDTDDLAADALIPLNRLATSTRYSRDKATLQRWHSTYPAYTKWFGVGHSLGGALVDALLRDGLLDEGFSFNPAIQPQDFENERHFRLYKEGDPMYDLFGRQDPNAVVVPRDEEGWFYWFWRNTSLSGKLYDYLSSHKLGSFGDLSGGSLEAFKPHTSPDGVGTDVGVGAGREVDVEVLFSALEDLTGGAFAPKFLYDTAENRTERAARPAELVRSRRDIELGLRALAHKFSDGPEKNPLAAFGARVMADDLYEHDTGDAIDWGHDNQAKKEMLRAFRDSRPDQIGELGVINRIMAQYNLPPTRDGRARAYRIAYAGEAPPQRAVVAPSRVAPPSVVREDVEAETRRMREERDAREAEDRRRREDEDRRMREEALRRRREQEEEEQRVREEEARRVRDELARQEREDEERKAREAEEEARRVAEEKRLEAERQRGVEAEAERARAEAVRLAKVALAQTDEFQVALDESAAVNALLAEKVSLQSIERQLKSTISIRKHWLKDQGKTAAEVLANPEAFARIRLPITGSPRGTQGQVMTLKTPPLPMKTILANIQALEEALPDIPEEVLSSPVGKTLTEEQKANKQVMLVEVEHPSARSWLDDQLLEMILPPPLWRDALESFKKAQVRLVEDIKGFIIEKQKVMSEDIPRWERESEEAEAKLAKVEREIASIDDRKRDLEKQFEARAKDRAKLAKVVAQAKPKKKGKGRQHNPFQYSRPNLTPAQKAAERAKHYRTVERAKAGEYEKHPGANRTLARFDPKTKEQYGSYTHPKFYEGDIRKVELTPEETAREAARGLKVKPKKVTLPKKDSVRKPYVGKVMKEAFMKAVAGRGEKEQKNLFNKAKRLYKEGGRAWEDITAELSGQ